MIDIYRIDDRRLADEASLVLTAMEIEHQLFLQDDAWMIAVAPADEAVARAQLEAYWWENRPPEVHPVEADVVDSGWWGVIVYLSVIWSLPLFQSLADGSLNRVGALDAAAVSQGEWYRAITALTLHADLPHIASNSLFGTLFGLWVGRYLGSGFGWLLVLVCGAIANLINGLIQPDGFRAIGASTATFAALGLVPAFGWRRGYFRGRGWARDFAPVFGAIAITAFTGFGGENTDVFGHLFGFIAGLAMGFACAHVDVTAKSVGDQQRAGIAALFAIAVCWGIALS